MAWLMEVYPHKYTVKWSPNAVLYDLMTQWKKGKKAIVQN